MSALDVRVWVPIRRGKDLAAAIALGPLQSGDVYTSTDFALLRAAAEKAGDQLAKLQDRNLLARAEFDAGQLSAAKERAEALNDRRARGLAAANHDLRQSLHALAGFVERLDESVEGDRMDGLVTQIRTSTEALGDMFSGLIDISRLDMGAIEVDRSTFTLGRVLDRLIAEFEPIAKRRGLRFASQSTDALVTTDAVLLGRIVQNLLSNAFRHTRRGGVKLSVIEEPARVAIEISDTGPGIPPELQREVFEEFVRLPGSDAGSGLGLGLSIVKRLTDLLGHDLDFESHPDHGTRFRITLDRAPDAAPTRKSANTATLAGRCILVIDDDLFILDGLRRVLREWGCQVIVAGNTSAALESLGRIETGPDLIVADYRLGETETGFDAIDAVAESLQRDLPAVMITSDPSAEIRQRCGARGIPLLRKPLVPAELIEALVEEIRRR